MKVSILVVACALLLSSSSWEVSACKGGSHGACDSDGHDSKDEGSTIKVPESDIPPKDGIGITKDGAIKPPSKADAIENLGLKKEQVIGVKTPPSPATEKKKSKKKSKEKEAAPEEAAPEETAPEDAAAPAPEEEAAPAEEESPAKKKAGDRQGNTTSAGVPVNVTDITGVPVDTTSNSTIVGFSTEVTGLLTTLESMIEALRTATPTEVANVTDISFLASDEPSDVPSDMPSDMPSMVLTNSNTAGPSMIPTVNEDGFALPTVEPMGMNRRNLRN
jgi:Pyruvate/2-oxoacid:ferredoxin oxidoreductase gamma subunit